MPVTITQERPDSADAAQLIAELDAILEPLYARESRHGFSVEKIINEGVEFFVVRRDGVPAGCGGVLLVGAEYGEVKRMYIRPQFRGQGLGRLILEHLKNHVSRQNIHLLRLETGIYQKEAISLYEQFGFVRIPPFGPYRPDQVSLCYEMRC